MKAHSGRQGHVFLSKITFINNLVGLNFSEPVSLVSGTICLDQGGELH